MLCCWYWCCWWYHFICLQGMSHDIRRAEYEYLTSNTKLVQQIDHRSVLYTWHLCLMWSFLQWPNTTTQHVQPPHNITQPNFLSGGFCSKVKIVTAQLFPTPPYFCWQLAFYWHLPTLGRQNTVKTAPQPLIVNSAFVALYVGIILPIGPIPISLFVFELEAED